MLHELVLGGEFFARLAVFDQQIAREVARCGCPYCAGPLHQANYKRKPRGGLLGEIGEQLMLRHSLSCGRPGCRRRVLPPSLRFLGRRVYLEAVVLLASLYAQLLTTLRAASAATGVPRWTLQRWGRFWREVFPRLPLWTELRALFVPPPPDETALPRSLLERLAADLGLGWVTGGQVEGEDVLRLAARCLAPGTTSSVRNGSRFVRGAALRPAPS